MKKAGYKGEKYFFGGHSLGGSSVSSWGKKGTILRLKEFSYGDLTLEEILLTQLQIMELLYSLWVQNLMGGWLELLV